MKQNHEKKVAGEAAADLIQNNMIVGLGTGSTVYYTIKKLGQRIKDENLDITCVSTSSDTTKLAKNLGIKLISLNDVKEIDITIDGADEIDRHLRAIKGGGGALLFEKIIASSSRKVVIVIDSTKYVDTLGKFPLPVEVLSFGHAYVFQRLREEGYQPTLRKKCDEPFITDSGNFIFDLNVKNMIDKVDIIELEKYLNNIPGVIENGLFNNIADVLYIGRNGDVEIKNNDNGH